MIAITGVSGSLGTKIANLLVELSDPTQFRLTSRTPEKLSAFADQGFETAKFDFDDADSMQTALEGCDTVLIISGTSPVEQRIQQQRNAIAAVTHSSVKRVVYTSFANASEDSLFPFAAIHADTEKAIIESNLHYTILRNPMYLENFAGPLNRALETGQLAIPGSEEKASYLLKDEIARITVNALLNAPGDKTLHELTGTDALDLYEVAAIASDAWGKTVTASQLPEDAFIGVLTGMGLPSFLVTALIGAHRATNAGEYKAATNEAETLLGKRPTSLEEYVRGMA